MEPSQKVKYDPAEIFKERPSDWIHFFTAREALTLKVMSREK
jgi:hypothetical protein